MTLFCADAHPKDLFETVLLQFNWSLGLFYAQSGLFLKGTERQFSRLICYSGSDSFELSDEEEDLQDSTSSFDED